MNEFVAALRVGRVRLRLGPFVVRFRVTLPEVAQEMHFLYARHPLVAEDAIVDFDVGVGPHGWGGARRAKRATLYLDGAPHFETFARGIALPMLQWCVNWCVFFRPHQYLILHSAVVERNGWAAIMPAPPGSGKSTLCTALVHHGWRLLSDEVALIDPHTGLVYGAPLPMSLKEESIEVIRNLAVTMERPRVGLAHPGTRKGTVAHVQPPAASIDRMHEPARPAWIITPRYDRQVEAQLEPQPPEQLFLAVAGDAFNYSHIGGQGFATLTDLFSQCAGYQITYRNMALALEIFDQLQPPATVAGGTGIAPDMAIANADDPTPSPRPSPAPGGTGDGGDALKTIPAQDHDLLLWALQDPRRLAALPSSRWNALLLQARMAKLEARLGVLLEEAGVLAQIPITAQRHLTAARVVARDHHRMLRWEVNRLYRALHGMDVPVVLLKGAAYLMGELHASHGRLVQDLDVLVPLAQLDAVEKALHSHGWDIKDLDPYDHRYYRTWMHELPPLKHSERRTVLDLHHNILPRTGRVHVETGKLLAAAVPLPSASMRVVTLFAPHTESGDARATTTGATVTGEVSPTAAEAGVPASTTPVPAAPRPRLLTLGPADMVLHSAAHMFQDGELDGSIRDLIDLDDLLRTFGTHDDFWKTLVPRARELHLARPLYWALRSVTQILGTPVPPQVMMESNRDRPWWPVPAVMDRLIRLAVIPDLPGETHRKARWARLLLYIRSHWLRMPPWLLAWHLGHKALRRAYQRLGWGRDKD